MIPFCVFFIAQCKKPTKDDWIEEVKKDLNELDIDMTLDDIKLKSNNSFKRIVKIKTKEYTLEYLLELKESHSKMDDLNYPKLKLQSYLKDSKITVEEAKNLYRYRTRVAKYKENMKNSFTNVSRACPICLVQPDTQVHSVSCPEVKSKVLVKGTYEDIFYEDIPSDISKACLLCLVQPDTQVHSVSCPEVKLKVLLRGIIRIYFMKISHLSKTLLRINKLRENYF